MTFFKCSDKVCRPGVEPLKCGLVINALPIELPSVTKPIICNYNNLISL